MSMLQTKFDRFFYSLITPISQRFFRPGVREQGVPGVWCSDGEGSVTQGAELCLGDGGERVSVGE